MKSRLLFLFGLCAAIRMHAAEKVERPTALAGEVIAVEPELPSWAGKFSDLPLEMQTNWYVMNPTEERCRAAVKVDESKGSLTMRLADELYCMVSGYKHVALTGEVRFVRPDGTVGTMQAWDALSPELQKYVGKHMMIIPLSLPVGYVISTPDDREGYGSMLADYFRDLGSAVGVFLKKIKSTFGAEHKDGFSSYFLGKLGYTKTTVPENIDALEFESKVFRLLISVRAEMLNKANIAYTFFVMNGNLPGNVQGLLLNDADLEDYLGTVIRGYLNNHYLVGKLLGYKEIDIKAFYGKLALVQHRGDEREQIQRFEELFELHKKAAVAWIAKKDAEEEEKLRLLEATVKEQEKQLKEKRQAASEAGTK